MSVPRGWLRLYGEPDWNLERAPFYIYMKNWTNELKYLYYWNKWNLSKKNELLTSINHNMNETHGFSKNIMYV